MIERVSIKSSAVESSVEGGTDCSVMCDELGDDDEEKKQLPVKRIKCKIIQECKYLMLC